MKGTWKWFFFGALDYKAAEGWLNRLGAGGWRLEAVHLGMFARFEQVEQPVSCCVDLGNLAKDALTAQELEYLQLCEDAGWELVCGVRGMSVFVSEPGACPVPIQTDPKLEETKFFRKYLLKGWLSCLAVLAFVIGLFLLCSLLPGRPWPYSVVLLDNANLAFLLFLAVSVAALAADIWGEVAYFLRCRRSVRAGLGMPVSSLAGIRFRSFMTLLCKVLQIVMMVLVVLRPLASGGTNVLSETDQAILHDSEPVVTAADLGLDDGPADFLYTREGGSLLVSYRTYQEYRYHSDEISRVVCDVYWCQGGWTAGLLSRMLLQDERAGRTSHIFHGGLDLQPVDLGFDGAWLAQGGGRDFLLLRQGSTVAVLEADTSLTAPDTLVLIRERLQLGA